MSFADVLACLEAGQVGKAVGVLRELPSESVSCESIRPWIFHPDDDLRQLVVTLLGQKGDVQSILDLARLFEAELDFYDHDFIFDAYVTMGEAAVPGLLHVVKHGTAGQRSAALQGLGQMGSLAVPFLIELLRGGEQDDLIFVALQNSRCPGGASPTGLSG